MDLVIFPIFLIDFKRVCVSLRVAIERVRVRKGDDMFFRGWCGDDWGRKGWERIVCGEGEGREAREERENGRREME